MFGLHLGLPLRVAAASGAAALLRTGGLDVVSRGASLDWQGSLVLVDPPCSGLSMLWVGCLFALVGSSALQLSNARILVSLGLAVVASWGANVLRTAALFRSEVGLFDLPEWGHEAVGLVSHFMAAALVLSFLQRSRASRPCASST